MLKGYNDANEAIKNLKTSKFFRYVNLVIKHFYRVVWSVEKTDIETPKDK